MLRPRHLVFVALLVSLAFCRARAADIYDCYNGSSEQGGNRVTVNGIQTNQYVQQSFPGATVTVYVHNTLTLATIYQDAAGTLPLANPFSSSAHSVAFVCAPDGRYDFKYSGTGITVPFTVSDIKFCFACQGGGGSVTPGTPYQVTRYDATGTNIQDSTGSDNPANGPTRWTNGLSVEQNAAYVITPNSPNGTTLNLLMCPDASVSTMTQATTCAVNSTNAYAVADNGAGTTGNVRGARIGLHAVVFDGQTSVNDCAIPSATTAGMAADAGATCPTGVERIGRITTANTGAGTTSIVDLQSWDVTTPASSGSVATCAFAQTNAIFTLAGNTVTCDQFVTDDTVGNMTMKSLGLTDTSQSGFWYQQKGPALPSLSGSNRFYFAAGTSFGTTYGVEPFDSAPTATHCVDLVAGDAAGWLKLHDAGAACGTGSGVTFQTNSVNNSSQTLLNLLNGAGPLGTTMTFTNTSGGNVQGTIAYQQLATPTTPTITSKGTTGATTYTYKIVGCQDQACTYHTPASSGGSTTNGNATLSSTNYSLITGYQMRARCFNVYRTAGGATQGLIAACVPFQFKDTGLAGDGTTAPSTNTTQVFPQSQPLPGCNLEMFSITGVDSPPCSPNTLDDEAQSTFGAPGDANNMWVWQTQGTATAAYTGGVIKMATSSTTTQLTCLTQPVPGSTPYSFVIAMYSIADGTGGGGGTEESGLAFFESGTGRYEWLNILAGLTTNPTRLQFGTWSSATSGDANQAFGPAGVGAFSYIKIQNDGTNLVYYWSADGITYTQLVSHAKTFSFTTGPTDVGICVDNNANSGHATDFDYFRRVQ